MAAPVESGGIPLPVLTPYLIFGLGLFNALITVIYKQLQKDVEAQAVKIKELEAEVKDVEAKAKEQVKELEARFDDFRRTEFRQLYDKLDEIKESMHNLALMFTEKYATKNELHQITQDRRRGPNNQRPD